MRLKNYTIYVLSFLVFNIHASKNIHVISIPKCGTHLLMRAIHLLTNLKYQIDHSGQIKNIIKKSKVFTGQHLKYSKEHKDFFLKNKYKLFFIYRDPRDQIISHAFWYEKNSEFYKIDKNHLNFDELIMYLIKNDAVHRYTEFLSWLNVQNICACKFEHLIGPNGGGTLKKQIKVIKKIIKTLNINVGKKKIKYCIKNLFGHTHTFRSGKIGEWKQYFNSSHIAEFKKVMGQLLIDLGYEKDLNW